MVSEKRGLDATADLRYCQFYFTARERERERERYLDHRNEVAAENSSISDPARSGILVRSADKSIQYPPIRRRRRRRRSE